MGDVIVDVDVDVGTDVLWPCFVPTAEQQPQEQQPSPQPSPASEPLTNERWSYLALCLPNVFAAQYRSTLPRPISRALTSSAVNHTGVDDQAAPPTSASNSWDDLVSMSASSTTALASHTQFAGVSGESNDGADRSAPK